MMLCGFVSFLPKILEANWVNNVDEWLKKIHDEKHISQKAELHSSIDDCIANIQVTLCIAEENWLK